MYVLTTTNLRPERLLTALNLLERFGLTKNCIFLRFSAKKFKLRFKKK
jgi:hypothetical protein